MVPNLGVTIKVDQQTTCAPSVLVQSSVTHQRLRSSTSLWASSDGFVKLFHPRDDKLDKTVHRRTNIGRSSGRNAVDCKCTQRQRQSSTPLVFPRRRHTGYAFLRSVITTARHQPRSQSYKQSEGFGQRIHCNVLRMDVQASAGAHTPSFRSSMSARITPSRLVAHESICLLQ